MDYWPLGRMRLGESNEAGQPPANESGRLPLSRLIVEKTPLFVLVAVSAAITYIVQQLGGAMGMLGQQAPLWRRLGNALFSCGQYLEESFWPSPLAAVYPYVNRRAINVLIVGLALGAISVAAVRLAKIRPFLIVGWCWYLGTLVPVIGIVQVGVQSMADRYTYIPLIGIFIIAVWGAAEFSEEWPMRNKAIATAVVLAVCGWCAWRQVATWSSSEALYKNAVETQRYNLFALHGLGMVYWKEGKLDEAQQQFEAMLKIQSDPTLHARGGLEPAHRALGLLLAVRHQPKEALKQFDAAIDDGPRQPEPRRQKAWLLATSLDNSVRNGKQAVACAEQALELSPGKQPEYWDTLAAAQAEAGKFKAAVESAEKALQQARPAWTTTSFPAFSGAWSYSKRASLTTPKRCIHRDCKDRRINNCQIVAFRGAKGDNHFRAGAKALPAAKRVVVQQCGNALGVVDAAVAHHLQGLLPGQTQHADVFARLQRHLAGR